MQQLFPEEDEDDFYAQFNLMIFLQQFIIHCFLLTPLKEFAYELNHIIEHMIDGGTSDNWWSPGVWFRSMMFSNVLKLFWVILIIYIVIKFLVAYNLLSWLGRFVYQIANDDVIESVAIEENPQNQIMNPRLNNIEGYRSANAGVVMNHVVINHHYVYRNGNIYLVSKIYSPKKT